MSNTLILFSGDKYHVPTQRTVEDAPKYGVDRVLVYDDWWLRTKRPQAWADMKHLWSLPVVKGVAWFCWKPLIILDAFNRCGPDDVIFYVDADTYPINDLKPVFDITRRDGHMVFRCNAQYHKWWTTSACLQHCGIPVDFNGVPLERDKYFGPDEKPVWHGCARFMGFMNNAENREFLNDWYRVCLIKDATTFDLPPPEKYGRENPFLHQHRTEQAIFTNLVLKRGWRMWREACQFGEAKDDGPQDRDAYDQLFFQDGTNSWAANPTGPGSMFRNIND